MCFFGRIGGEPSGGAAVLVFDNPTFYMSDFRLLTRAVLMRLALFFFTTGAIAASPAEIAVESAVKTVVPESVDAAIRCSDRFIGRMRDMDMPVNPQLRYCWSAEEDLVLVYAAGEPEATLIDTVKHSRRPVAFAGTGTLKPEFAFGEKGGIVVYSAGRWWRLASADNTCVELSETDADLADARWDIHRDTEVATSGRHATLLVRNESGRELGLFWKNGASMMVSYGTVSAGGSHEQQTYAGHEWEVRDADGKVFDRFKVPEGGGVATVERPVATATNPSRKKKRTEPNRNETVSISTTKAPPTAPDFLNEIRDGAVVARSGSGAEVTIPVKLAPGEQLSELNPSEDGRWVAAVCLTTAPVRQLVYTEQHPKGSDKPRVFNVSYPKPGDAMDGRRVALVDVTGGKEVPVDPAVFGDVWDFRVLGWSPEGGECLVYLHYRSHKVTRFVAVRRDGSIRTVLEERAETFIDYSQKGWFCVLGQSWQLLWLSERDGRSHIYRFDLKTGALINRVTQGDFIVKSVESVNEETGQLFCSALAVRKGEDPYYNNLLRCRIDGSAPPVVLTHGDGFHTWEFSPEKRFLVDRWSRVDQPPSIALRDASTGETVSELVTRTAADVPKGFPTPERFTAKGRDGKTDIYGVIFRPSCHKAGDKLPVIEYIYAGPHGFHVPKTWGVRDMFLKLSEQGYAVVVIDGMGTNWRDRAFHDVAYKNIKDAGFPDRIVWMKAAEAKYPELDISKVGIIGGSAGGQNAAAALIWHNDFYKVAVADCGCHDNRVDKTWWNEAWMGWPVDASYAASSNIDHASLLRGDILLLLGEIDTNVDVASTYRFAEELKKAGHPYGLYVVPGGGHFVYFDREAFRRVSAFFAEKIPVQGRR